MTGQPEPVSGTASLRQQALGHDEPTAVFKGFRKTEEDRLRLAHKNGGGGREVARQRSEMVDVLLRELFSHILARHAPRGLPEPVVVAAFGGYGRRELSPFSDIDIIFLHPKSRLSPVAEECIRQTLTALWDIGFKVGHATRSLRDALKTANEDLVVKTSMLECRFLAGDRELFASFRKRFERECVQGREAAYIRWRLDNQARLHAKYGGSIFMQEPHLKNGVGGLRSYQNLLWLAYFKERVMTPAKLVEKKILRDAERRSLETGYDFLLRTRTALHHLAGRSSDLLTLQMQGRVAAALGYPEKHILRRIEAFMRDYYTHARQIAFLTTAATTRLEVIPETLRPRLLGFLQPRAARFDGFLAKGGRLFPESPKALAADPFRMMRAFHHAQSRHLGLSGELRDAIRNRLSKVDTAYQYATPPRETFLNILSRKGEVGRILREMHTLGFLGTYIPEFGDLTCLVQHEFYHRYTADEHTLVCIEKLDSVLFSEDVRFRGYRALLQQFEDPAILYLAILLHDIGKAANKRHHEDISATLADRVAHRLQLAPQRRKMLVTLVNAHGEMSAVAQKRNLEDPATIRQFAGIVGNKANLDALMLVTLADGMGTGDEKWSDWKETLVWTLHRNTAQYLERGEESRDASHLNIRKLRDQVAELLPPDFTEEISAHFEFMPDRYWRMFEAETVAGHLRLFRDFLGNHLRSESGALTPALHWIAHPELGHSEVWVCGWDRPRLLERIAGAFLSCHINILSADIFTRSDNLVLDCFHVDNSTLSAISAKEMARVESRLVESLRVEMYDFTPLLGRAARLRSYRISQEADLPSVISVSNSSHPVYTLVDIQTPDRLGLLYGILRALGEAGVNIETSRISTERDVALDSFYITGKNGGKVADAAAVRRLQLLLEGVCDAPRDEPPPATEARS